MKSLVRVLPFLALPSLVLAQIRPQTIAPVIDQFEIASSVAYITKVADIPQSVLDAAKTVIRGKEFAMADTGKKWNATDVVDDIQLPFRRLIWCTTVKDYFVMHYELGGRGHSVHFIVFSPEDVAGKRRVEWVAASFESAPDLKTFTKRAKAGELVSDTKIGH